MTVALWTVVLLIALPIFLDSFEDPNRRFPAYGHRMG